jgi:hypothetical protein
MGYMHIDNLYKNKDLLMFKKVYALEKIHGTSAHISFRRVPGQVSDLTEDEVRAAAETGELLVEVAARKVKADIGFFSGGEKYDNFVKLFDLEDLKKRFLEAGPEKMTVFGEAYGGRQQGMKDTYGPVLKFVAFDVLMSDNRDPNAEPGSKIWLGVESATRMVERLGLEFVAWNLVDTDLASLDRERDLPSRQAVRNGITEPRIAEGVVLRPPIEVRTNNGGRLIAKHKRPEFSERSSKKDTQVTPEKLAILSKAEEIATEWVTTTRLEHVLDKIQAQKQRPPMMEDTREVIDAMVEDVTREAKGEIVESKEAIKAISSTTAKLFAKVQRKRLEEAAGH